MLLETDFLNAKGLQLVELKKALTTDNELIQIPLKESVNAMKLKSAIKDALTNKSAVEDLVDMLLKEKQFSDQDKIFKVYGQYAELLERALKKKNLRVQFDTNVKEGIVVVKRFGAQSDFVEDYLKLTYDEYEELQKSGFVETYMTTLARSMKREFEEKLKVSKTSLPLYNPALFSVDVSDVYYDEDADYYNVDVRIKLKDYKTLGKPKMLESISTDINKILTSLQGAYFRRMNL